MGFYRRFNGFEREELSRSLAAGMSLRVVARQLGRHASTLSRELRRTGRSKVTYRMSEACVSHIKNSLICSIG